jgi:hypothetical protein|tara:strand:- start:465 stop:668 length:204 start_codon:yes stop_codon:yes gene_type:complete
MELIRKAKEFLNNGKEYWRYYENTYIQCRPCNHDEVEAQGQEGSFSRKLSSQEKAKLTTRRYRRLEL